MSFSSHQSDSQSGSRTGFDPKNFHFEKEEVEDGVTITTSIDNGLKTVTKKYDDGNTQKSTSKVIFFFGNLLNKFTACHVTGKR